MMPPMPATTAHPAPRTTTMRRAPGRLAARALCFAPVAALALVAGCTPPRGGAVHIATTPPRASTGGGGASAHSIAAEHAARYLALTLEAGTYEDEYIDAYYGPAALRAAAAANPRPPAALITAAQDQTAAIDALLQTAPFAPNVQEPAYSARRRMVALRGLLVAAATRLRMIGGHQYPFDDEAAGLFGTVPATQPLAHYDGILARLDGLVPGTGPLAARVDAFNDRYIIPADRLRAVFDAAIAECRARTAAHITLPAGEHFTLEFVTGKPWSGYNYYQGGYRSLIQVNTDLPIRLSRAVDLGCHEGYPGHHVLNLLIEQRLVNQRGWHEYQVNPLYSPQSVLSEGSANYGIDLAFPGPERLRFERDTLYPLAGLNPATASAYWQVQQATDALAGARLTIARLYLDGAITRAQAVALTGQYLLLSPARAEQSVGFTDHYRSYVLNYGWGKDMVRRHVERGNANAETRWQRMESLLAQPTQPADLIVN
ncbi:MAG: hypothetical protein ACKOUM_04295 [Sphingopyxis sp.]